MPNGIFHPWVRWDWGVEVAGEFFHRRRRRRRRRRPLPKWVFGELPNPPFYDTYERSTRATGWYRLVISLRRCVVFVKSGMS